MKKNILVVAVFVLGACKEAKPAGTQARPLTYFPTADSGVLTITDGGFSGRWHWDANVGPGNRRVDYVHFNLSGGPVAEPTASRLREVSGTFPLRWIGEWEEDELKTGYQVLSLKNAGELGIVSFRKTSQKSWNTTSGGPLEPENGVDDTEFKLDEEVVDELIAQSVINADGGVPESPESEIDEDQRFIVVGVELLITRDNFKGFLFLYPDLDVLDPIVDAGGVTPFWIEGQWTGRKCNTRTLQDIPDAGSHYEKLADAGIHPDCLARWNISL